MLGVGIGGSYSIGDTYLPAALQHGRRPQGVALQGAERAAAPELGGVEGGQARLLLTNEIGTPNPN